MVNVIHCISLYVPLLDFMYTLDLFGEYLVKNDDSRALK